MNYINMDPNCRDNKNYSFNNLSNNNKNRGHRIISIQDNNFMSNKGSSGDGRILNNNIYNMNFQKRIGGDKDNNNLNKNMNNNKNFRNDFGSHTQGSVSTYEYKGFKTFNFK